MLHFTKCAICGKDFIEAPLSVYKVKVNGKMLHCCSYTCMREAEKLKPLRGKKKKDENKA